MECNYFLAERLMEHEVKDALSEAKHARLLQATKGLRTTRGRRRLGFNVVRGLRNFFNSVAALVRRSGAVGLSDSG